MEKPKIRPVFAGIVTHTGPLVASESLAEGLRLRVDLGTLSAEVGVGDSICVAGACLTVAALAESVADFEVSPETLTKTRFSGLVMGDLLNLELSLCLGDRLGGHFVTGHVDGLGRLEGLDQQDPWTMLTISAPPTLAHLLVPKGSVTVDGVSLTVASLEPPSSFSVALIPETLDRTTLSQLGHGDPVHLEGDLLGKFVHRSLQTGSLDPDTSSPS